MAQTTPASQPYANGTTFPQNSEKTYTYSDGDSGRSQKIVSNVEALNAIPTDPSQQGEGGFTQLIICVCGIYASL